MPSPISDSLRALARAQRAQADALDAVADALDAGASDVLDVGQVAQVARCSPRSVRAAIRRGELRARGRGRHVVVDRADLDAWLRDLPPRPSAQRDDEHDEDAIAAEVERRMDREARQ